MAAESTWIDVGADTEVEVPPGVTPNEVRAAYEAGYGATPEVRESGFNRYNKISGLREGLAADLAPGSRFQREQLAEVNQDLLEPTGLDPWTDYLNQGRKMGGALLASGLMQMGAGGAGALRMIAKPGTEAYDRLGRVGTSLSEMADVTGASPVASQSADIVTSIKEGSLRDVDWSLATPEEKLALAGGRVADVLNPIARSYIQTAPQMAASVAGGSALSAMRVPGMVSSVAAPFTVAAPLTAGESFNRLIAMGVDPDTARRNATFEGMISGGLEAVADAPLIRGLTGGKVSGGLMGGKGLAVNLGERVGTAVGRPLGAGAGRLGGRVGAGVGTALQQPLKEGATEVGQEATSIATDAMATGEMPDWERAGHRLASAGLTGVGVGAIGGGAIGLRNLGESAIRGSQLRRMGAPKGEISREEALAFFLKRRDEGDPSAVRATTMMGNISQEAGPTAVKEAAMDRIIDELAEAYRFTVRPRGAPPVVGAATPYTGAVPPTILGPELGPEPPPTPLGPEFGPEIPPGLAALAQQAQQQPVPTDIGPEVMGNIRAKRLRESAERIAAQKAADDAERAGNPELAARFRALALARSVAAEREARTPIDPTADLTVPPPVDPTGMLARGQALVGPRAEPVAAPEPVATDPTGLLEAGRALVTPRETSPIVTPDEVVTPDASQRLQGLSQTAQEIEGSQRLKEMAGRMRARALREGVAVPPTPEDPTGMLARGAAAVTPIAAGPRLIVPDVPSKAPGERALKRKRGPKKAPKATAPAPKPAPKAAPAPAPKPAPKPVPAAAATADEFVLSGKVSKVSPTKGAKGALGRKSKPKAKKTTVTVTKPVEPAAPAPKAAAAPAAPPKLEPPTLTPPKVEPPPKITPPKQPAAPVKPPTPPKTPTAPSKPAEGGKKTSGIAEVVQQRKVAKIREQIDELNADLAEEESEVEREAIRNRIAELEEESEEDEGPRTTPPPAADRTAFAKETMQQAKDLANYIAEANAEAKKADGEKDPINKKDLEDRVDMLRQAGDRLIATAKAQLGEDAAKEIQKTLGRKGRIIVTEPTPAEPDEEPVLEPEPEAPKAPSKPKASPKTAAERALARDKAQKKTPEGEAAPPVKPTEEAKAEPPKLVAGTYLGNRKSKTNERGAFTVTIHNGRMPVGYVIVPRGTKDDRNFYSPLFPNTPLGDTPEDAGKALAELTLNPPEVREVQLPPTQNPKPQEEVDAESEKRIAQAQLGETLLSDKSDRAGENIAPRVPGEETVRGDRGNFYSTWLRTWLTGTAGTGKKGRKKGTASDIFMFALDESTGDVVAVPVYVSSQNEVTVGDPAKIEGVHRGEQAGAKKVKVGMRADKFFNSTVGTGKNAKPRFRPLRLVKSEQRLPYLSWVRLTPQQYQSVLAALERREPPLLEASGRGEQVIRAEQKGSGSTKNIGQVMKVGEEAKVVKSKSGAPIDVIAKQEEGTTEDEPSAIGVKGIEGGDLLAGGEAEVSDSFREAVLAQVTSAEKLKKGKLTKAEFRRRVETEFNERLRSDERRITPNTIATTVLTRISQDFLEAWTGQLETDPLRTDPRKLGEDVIDYATDILFDQYEQGTLAAPRETLPPEAGILGAGEEIPKGRASVPFQMTRDMRQQLADLGYTRAQVNAMKPEEAGAIIDGNVRAEAKPKEAAPKGAEPPTLPKRETAPTGAVPPTLPKREVQNFTDEGTVSELARTALSQYAKDHPVRALFKKIQAKGVKATVRVLDDDAYRARFGNTARRAYYDQKTNTIFMHPTASAQTALHEIGHAGTVTGLRNNGKFRTEIGRLRDVVRALPNADQASYALADRASRFETLAEFVTEAMSNEEFRAFLKANEDPGTGLSLWTRFVNALKRLFRLSPKHANLLDQIISTIEPNIEMNVAGELSRFYGTRNILPQSMKDISSELTGGVVASQEELPLTEDDFKGRHIQGWKTMVGKLPSAIERTIIMRKVSESNGGTYEFRENLSGQKPSRPITASLDSILEDFTTRNLGDKVRQFVSENPDGGMLKIRYRDYLFGLEDKLHQAPLDRVMERIEYGGQKQLPSSDYLDVDAELLAGPEELGQTKQRYDERTQAGTEADAESEQPGMEGVPAAESREVEAAEGDEAARGGKPNTLYRETSIGGLLGFDPKDAIHNHKFRLYFATTPELALGQGNNRGVSLEFDETKLPTDPVQKPGAGVITGGGEERVTVTEYSNAANALKSITIQPGAKASNIDARNAKRFLSDLEQRGWSRTKNEDGSVTYAAPEETETEGLLGGAEQIPSREAAREMLRKAAQSGDPGSRHEVVTAAATQAKLYDNPVVDEIRLIRANAGEGHNGYDKKLSRATSRKVEWILNAASAAKGLGVDPEFLDSAGRKLAAIMRGLGAGANVTFTPEDEERLKAAAQGVVLQNARVETYEKHLEESIASRTKELIATIEKNTKRVRGLKFLNWYLPAAKARLLNGYKGYIKAFEKRGASSITDKERFVINRGRDAALDPGGATSRAIERALLHIAKNVPTAALKGLSTPEEVADYLHRNGTLQPLIAAKALTNKEAAILLGLDESGARVPGSGVLESIPSVSDMLVTLGSYAAERSNFDNDIKEFEDWFKNIVKSMSEKPSAVELRRFANAYGKLSVNAYRASKALREYNSSVDYHDIQIRAETKALEMVKKLRQDPTYNEQYGQAVKIMGVLDPVKSGLHAGRIARGLKDDRVNAIYKVGDTEYTETYSLDPKDEDKNRENMANMAAHIDRELKRDDIDPATRASLEHQRGVVERYLNLGTLGPETGSKRENPFDIMRHMQENLPWLTLFMTRTGLNQFIPGRMGDALRLHADAQNYLDTKLGQLNVDRLRGTPAIVEASAKAIASHGEMTPEVWSRDVMGPLLGDGQDSKDWHIKVGQRLVPTGHVVTQEDLDAAAAQHRYVKETIKIVQAADMKAGGTYSFMPQLTEQVIKGPFGGVTMALLRKAYSAGQYTVPRRYNTGSVTEDHNFTSWNEKWNVARKALGNNASPEAIREAQIKLLQGDPLLYNNLALAHAGEVNPEYKRNSVFETAYRSLAREWRSGEAKPLPWRSDRAAAPMPKTWDELVDQVTLRHIELSQNRRARPTELVEIRPQVRDGMYGEIDKFMRRFQERMDGQARPENLEDIKSVGAQQAILDLHSTEGAFVSPREEMIAPSTFFRMPLTSDFAMNGFHVAARLPGQLREIFLMQAVGKQLGTERLRLAREMREGRLTPDQIDKKVRSGELFATMGRLEMWEKILKSKEQEYSQKISTSKRVARENANWIESLFALDRAAVLSSAPAMIGNFISGAVLGRVLPAFKLGAWEGLKAGAKAPFTVGRDVLLDAANKFPAAKKWVQENLNWAIPIVGNVAARAAELEGVRQAGYVSGGIRTPMTMADRQRVAKATGFVGGRSMVPGSESEDPNDIRTRASQLFAKNKLGVFLAEMFPQLIQNVEQWTNAQAMFAAHDVAKSYVGSGYGIMESRSTSGVPNWDDFVKNPIKPDEAKAAAGWSPETLATLRQLFARAGGLEAVLHSYWRRQKAAKEAGQPDPPVFENEGDYPEYLLNIAALSNLPLPSRRPDALKGSSGWATALRSMFTFVGWSSNYVNHLNNMFATVPSTAKWTSAGAAAIALLSVLASLIAAGIPPLEARKFVYELANDRPYAAPTMSSLFEDPRLSTALKVAGSSAASNIPYAGTYLANFLGAPTVRPSEPTLSAFSRPLSMAIRTFGEVSKAAKTGDVAGGAIGVAQTLLPVANPITSRIPGVSERRALTDAARVARVAAGPIEVKAFGGGGGEPSEFSSLVRRAVAAEAGGDSEAADRLMARAEAVKERERPGSKGRSAVRSSLSGMKPDRVAFGRKLSEDEKAGLFERMTAAQKAAYDRGEDAVTRLMNRTKPAGATTTTAKPKKALTALESSRQRLTGSSKVRKSTVSASKRTPSGSTVTLSTERFVRGGDRGRSRLGAMRSAQRQRSRRERRSLGEYPFPISEMGEPLR